MSKYISIFALTFGVSFILYFLFGYVWMSEADSLEAAIYTIGAIIIILLSFIIAQFFYVIDLIKKQRK